MRQDILEFLSPWLTATIDFKFLVAMAQGDKRLWISCRHDSWRQEMSSASQYRYEEMLFVAVTHGDEEHLLRTIPRKGFFFFNRIRLFFLALIYILRQDILEFLSPWLTATIDFKFLVAMAQGDKRLWISCRHDSWRQEMSSASQYRYEEMLFVAVTHGDEEHLLRTIPRKGFYFFDFLSNKTIFSWL